MKVIDLLIAQKLSGGGGVSPALLDDIKTALEPLLNDVAPEDYDTVIGEYIDGLKETNEYITGENIALKTQKIQLQDEKRQLQESVSGLEAEATELRDQNTQLQTDKDNYKGYLDDIKQAIIDKGGNVDDSTAYSDYDDAIAGLQTGAGFTGTDIIENGSALITEADYATATKIAPYAFFLSDIRNANFPKCSTVGICAFSECYRLITANFPVCTNVSGGAFQCCLSLTTVNLPLCETVGECAFQYCNSLSTANFPACTRIGAYGFYYCENFHEANFPACSLIGDCAFMECYNLTTADFPACTRIGAYGFHYCSSLTTASFPACDHLEEYGFTECCSLLSLYLLGSSVASWDDTNAFHGTPINDYTDYTNGVHGSIFVRASLLDQWKTATNWALYSDRFVGLTDEEIEALNQ